jgi:hypothetical protein
VTEELIRKLKSKGIDVDDVLLDALSRKDPEESVKERLKLAERYLNEAKEYLQRGDPIQASEKAYKVAEELIKALSERFHTSEYEEFLEMGKWSTYLLGKASKSLSVKLGDWVINGWNSAFDLHVWGFHEAKYNVRDVEVGLRIIEEMFKEAKKVLEGISSV